ncbi:MAG: nuclear transport factor 2 family protein [Azospirillaceae bacterium]
MPGDFDAITDLLQTYFDGLYLSDVDRLARVFHPRARYVTASGEDLVDLSMAEYFAIVAARPSPASRRELRQDRIVAIAFAGPRTAFARVNCAIGERAFTDFLTLVRDAGAWRIIAKVFHYDIISPGPAASTARAKAEMSDALR